MRNCLDNPSANLGKVTRVTPLVCLILTMAVFQTSISLATPNRLTHCREGDRELPLPDTIEGAFGSIYDCSADAIFTQNESKAMKWQTWTGKYFDPQHNPAWSDGPDKQPIWYETHRPGTQEHIKNQLEFDALTESQKATVMAEGLEIRGKLKKYYDEPYAKDFPDRMKLWGIDPSVLIDLDKKATNLTKALLQCGEGAEAARGILLIGPHAKNIPDHCTTVMDEITQYKNSIASYFSSTLVKKTPRTYPLRDPSLKDLSTHIDGWNDAIQNMPSMNPLFVEALLENLASFKVYVAVDQHLRRPNPLGALGDFFKVMTVGLLSMGAATRDSTVHFERAVAPNQKLFNKTLLESILTLFETIPLRDCSDWGIWPRTSSTILNGFYRSIYELKYFGKVQFDEGDCLVESEPSIGRDEDLRWDEYKTPKLCLIARAQRLRRWQYNACAPHDSEVNKGIYWSKWGDFIRTYRKIRGD